MPAMSYALYILVGVLLVHVGLGESQGNTNAAAPDLLQSRSGIIDPSNISGSSTAGHPGQQGPGALRGNSTYAGGGSNTTRLQSPQHPRQQINFSRVPSIVLVKPGGRLSITGVDLVELADVFSYTCKAEQPYINQAVGYVLWPSISLAPGAQVSLDNVEASFINPSLLDTCEEFMARQTLGLQSLLGSGNVTAPNATSVAIIGPVHVDVLVQAGNTQETVGEAVATFKNTTFVCLPNPMGQTGFDPGQSASGPEPAPTTGLNPGQQAQQQSAPSVQPVASGSGVGAGGALVPGQALNPQQAAPSEATSDVPTSGGPASVPQLVPGAGATQQLPVVQQHSTGMQSAQLAGQGKRRLLQQVQHGS